MSNRMARFSFFLVVVCLFAASAYAQTETGQIVGMVTDPSHGVVPKAKVTVRNVGTGAERSSITNDAGGFTVTSLLPAVYEVTVEATGFAKYLQRVEVIVGSKIGLEIVLAVGTATEVVEVVGERGFAVNTETQTLGVVIDSKNITELPTLTRNPYDLIGTGGNVTATADAGLSTRGGGYQINGLRAASNNILLDGASNNDEFLADVGQRIPLDAVQELKVLTNNFTAEYGRAAGGVVNVVTKSGTNSLHGTAYEFNRVSDLAANTFDNNARGIKKPVFVRNQFGYSVTGPVKKDKLFFSQSTEWIRVRSAAPRVVWVPTPQLLAAAAPATRNFFSTFGTLRSGLLDLGSFSRSQLIAQGQDPCSGSAATGPCNTLFPAASATPMLHELSYSVPRDGGGGTPQNSYELVGRVDWNINSDTTLYGRYALEDQSFLQGSNANSAYDGYDAAQKNRNNNFLLSVTHTFSPRLVSVSKIVFNRLNNFQPLGKNPVGPILYLRDNATSTLLGNFINFPGYLPFTPGNGIPFGGPQNYVQAYEDLSLIKGKHTFRFGGSYVYIRDNRAFGAYQEATEGLSTTSQGVGWDNFLNGVIARFQGAIDPQGKLPCGAVVTPQCTLTLPVGPPVFARSNRYHEFATYFQDSLKATRRITLNLGIRWEYFGVQHNKNPFKDSNYYDAVTGSAFTDIRQGGVAVAPLSSIGGLWGKDWHDFAPRLGFAWDVFGNGKTSLRGGYGISYERNFGNVTFNVIQNPPSYAVLALTPFDLGGTPIPVTTDNAGPLAGSTGSKAFPKTSLRNVDSRLKAAYAHFWSLAVEREALKNMLVAVEYSGSKGHGLYTIENPNRIGSGNIYLGDPCPTTPCLPAALTRLQNFQYTNINRRGGKGLSLYNGVNFRTDVRNIGNSGITLEANYTYSHAADNLSSSFSESDNNNNLGLLDPFDPKLDRGSADFDQRHRFAVSGTWDVPFARNVSSSWAKRVLDGWRVAPIFTAHSGNPYTLYDCTNANPSSGVCPRAMVSGARPAKLGVDNVPAAGAKNVYNYITLPVSTFSETYVNPIVNFSEFGPFPSSMLPRNYFRGPGAWNVTFGVYKSTKITERTSVQLRAELFNAFNHSNLYYVNGDNDLSGLATGGNIIIHAHKGVPPTLGGTLAADERRNLQLALKFIF